MAIIPQVSGQNPSNTPPKGEAIIHETTTVEPTVVVSVSAEAQALAPLSRPQRFLESLSLKNPWTWLTALLMGMVLTPLLFISVALFSPDVEGHWAHLVEHKLGLVLFNSFFLMLGTGITSLVVGVSCAWLVTMCQFPGRKILEWALLLPLAVPAYIMAYTYTDFLAYAGPVQTGLREWFGFTTKADYWFPPYNSVGGASVIMGMVLYPYVYLTCRSSFLDQSVCVLEAGRTLGKGPWSCFIKIALPLARPGIVAGLSLVLMETLADYGTVDYFGIPSFTVEIFRAWTGFGSYETACKLAASLLFVVALVLTLERLSRGRKRYHHTTGHLRHLPSWKLSPLKSLLAILACSIPLFFGFLLPSGLLLKRAIHHGDVHWQETITTLSVNSFIVSAIAAVLVLIAAFIIVFVARLLPNPFTALCRRIGGLGYAVPGSVIAIAIVYPFGAIDNAVDGIARSWFDVSTGLLLSGTIGAVLFAYVIRFLAVGMGSLDAGLGRIPLSHDGAARTLGARPSRVLFGVHMPMLKGAIFTSLLMVFVDVMKELPATMILRPFNFDTLAVRTHNLASDERLGEAAFPALVIVAVGLLPVFVLSRFIAKSRSSGGQ